MMFTSATLKYLYSICICIIVPYPLLADEKEVMELKVLLPLHKNYDKVGWHWGKQRTKSIEIVKHETYKDNDVEILTLKIKDNGPMHWLTIVSNEHCERTPDVVLVRGRTPLASPGVSRDPGIPGTHA